MAITVSIRARSLHYVCAEGGGGETIVVNRQTPGAWETLIVESWGDRFAFRCANGMLIAAPDGGRAGSLISKHPWDTPGHDPGSDELFRIYAVGDGYAIQCEHGRYWSAEEGGGGRLRTKYAFDEPEHAPGADEIFTSSLPLPVSRERPPIPTPAREREREPETREREREPEEAVGRVSSGTGGVWLEIEDQSVHRRLSAEEIRSLVPRSRGRFVMPPPWNTQAIRLTDPGDGVIEPVGYSYWRTMNNHAGQSEILAFVARSGRPAMLLAVNKARGDVELHSELEFPGTGEQWYFSARQPFDLYHAEGNRLLRSNLQTGASEVVLSVDSQHYLWQPHSSADDRVHSATLRDSRTEARIGAVVSIDERVQVFETRGTFDECQPDKSGRYLLIKETVDDVLNNRIIDLQTSEEMVIRGGSGAVGHSDMGYGYVVGEDGKADQPGAVRLWRFNDLRGSGQVIYHMHGWGGPNGMTRHIAHGNARPGDPRDQYVIMSHAHRDDLPRANEHVKVMLDGSRCQAIAPNLVDLDAPGGGEDYRKMPKGNIDITGEWFMWSANCGTGRIDVFMVRVPQ